MSPRAIARRLLAGMRRTSDGLYRLLLLVLLAMVYVLVIPWYALALRLRGRRATGWLARSDSGVGALQRLRSPY